MAERVPHPEASFVAELMELATRAGANMGAVEVLQVIAVVKRAVEEGENREALRVARAIRDAVKGGQSLEISIHG